MNPRISVIIPTYNSAKTLAVCLQSLADQTYRDFEVLILDGVSKDETISIANGFVDLIPNLFVLSEPDKGIYDAMNKGIGLANGEWLYFLGSDDSLFDEMVFLRISKHLESFYSLVYGNVKLVGQDSSIEINKVYGGKFDNYRLARHNFCHQSIFYRKILFEQFGMYDLKYPLLADWQFNIRIFMLTKTLYVDILIARFFINGSSYQFDNTEPFVNQRAIFGFEKLSHSVLNFHYRVHTDDLKAITSYFWNEKKWKHYCKALMRKQANNFFNSLFFAYTIRPLMTITRFKKR